MYVHHTVCIMCCLYKCIFGEYTRSHRNFVHLQQNVEKIIKELYNFCKGDRNDSKYIFILLMLQETNESATHVF